MTQKNKIIVAYIPVLHQGYFEFLSKHKDAAKLWLLDKKVMSQFPFFKKDVRKLEPALVKQGIESWGFRFEIGVVATSADLKKISSEKTKLILPNDEISHALVDGGKLSASDIVYDPVFLRWSKHIIKKQQPVSPDQKITTAELDKVFMGKAFEAATRSTNWWRHVGAVVARDGQQVLVGWNHHLPTEYSHFIDSDMRSLFSSGVEIELASSIHAEADLIAQAAKKGISLEGCDMYVTAFPCPVCAKQIAAAGIARLFFANGYSLIDGEDILKAAGVEILQVQLSEDELAKMNEPDLQRHIIKSY